MAAVDKLKNSAQRAKGKLTEAAGSVTGNRRLRRKGKTDRAKGTLKQTGERVKDAVKGDRATGVSRSRYPDRF